MDSDSEFIFILPRYNSDATVAVKAVCVFRFFFVRTHALFIPQLTRRCITPSANPVPQIGKQRFFTGEQPSTAVAQENIMCDK